MSLLTISGFLLGFGGALIVYRLGFNAGVKASLAYLEIVRQELAEKDRKSKVAELYGKSESGQS